MDVGRGRMAGAQWRRNDATDRDLQGVTPVESAPTRPTMVARGPGGEFTYRRRMTEPITPEQLSAELGVSDRAIRQWLRDQGWQSVPYARWELSPEQAQQVRTHFRG